MRFLYVFVLMFLVVFGSAVLLKVLFCALFDSSTRKLDIYVRDGEGIEEFLENARRAAFVGRITVITDKKDGELERLSEKYADVGFICETEW